MKRSMIIPVPPIQIKTKVVPKTPQLTEETLKEFRMLYTDIFGDKETVEETPEVLAHPGYKRYSLLAPLFYSMMVKKRREIGWRS